MDEIIDNNFSCKFLYLATTTILVLNIFGEGTAISPVEKKGDSIYAKSRSPCEIELDACVRALSLSGCDDDLKLMDGDVDFKVSE